MSRYGLPQNYTIRTCTVGKGTRPEDLDSINILNRLRYWFKTRSERVSILQCEQKWIKKLKSKMPYGMKKRRNLSPPIYFSLKYMDKTPAINNLVRSRYKTGSGNQSGISMTRKLVCTS